MWPNPQETIFIQKWSLCKKKIRMNEMQNFYQVSEPYLRPSRKSTIELFYENS